MGYWAEGRVPLLDEETLARLPKDVPLWRIAYWEMQRRLGREHLVPFLKKQHALPDEGAILEVGPSEGGVLHALIEGSKRQGDGLELSMERTEIAVKIAAALGDAMKLTAGDITQKESLSSLRKSYDVVLFRDVIEHIPDIDAALENARALTHDDGALVFSFPPYWSPFGAHQQIASRRALRLPYVQMNPLFSSLVKHFEPDEEKRDELSHLRGVALTLDRFEKKLARHGLMMKETAFYLSRPIFNVRWGLPVVDAGPIGKIPLLREVLVTGAWYLVKKAPRTSSSRSP